MIALVLLPLFTLQDIATNVDGVEAAGEELLREADAHYWFALAENDDIAAIDKGIDLVDDALALLAADPKSKIRLRAEGLREELLAQREMGRDTLEGVFPLFRHLASGIGRNVLVDDPWVISSTEAIRELSELVGRTWPAHAQIDTVVRTRIRHDDERPRETAGTSRILSNELAYVLGSSARLYFHHDAELRSMLGSDGLERLQQMGQDPALHEVLLDGFNADRFLLLDLEDHGTRPPLWFALARGTLVERAAGPVGTVRALGFALDRRDHLLRLLGATLGLLAISLLAATSGTRGRARPRRAGAAALLFLFGASSATVAMRFVGRFLAEPEMLVAEAAWAPLALAATAAWGPALILVFAGIRLPHVREAILPQGRPWNAGWLPLALGGAVPMTWALFLVREPREAALVTALLVLSLMGASRMLDGEGRAPVRAGGAAVFGAWFASLALVAIVSEVSAHNVAAWCWLVGLGAVGLTGAAMSMARQPVGGVAAAAGALLAATAVLNADSRFLVAPALAAGIVLVAQRRETGEVSPPEAARAPSLGELEKLSLTERLARIQDQKGPFTPWPGFDGLVQASIDKLEREGVTCLVLQGPSGAGKTRSIDELFRRLGVADGALMTGRCRDPKSAPEPMAPFTEALGRRVASQEGATQEVIRLVGGMLPIPGILETMAEPEGGGEGGYRARRMPLAMFHALRRGADGAVAGLAIDAAEHLDDESAAVLKTLIQLVRSQDPDGPRLRLVIQASVQEPKPLPEAFDESKFLVHRLRVQSGFLERFLCDAIGLDDELGSVLVRAAGDLKMTPLWALEWVELAVGEGILNGDVTGPVPGPGGLDEVAHLGKIMPASVDAASQEVLSLLPEETGRLLRCGALAGMEFDLDALHSVFGEERIVLVEYLQPALDRGVLEDLEVDGEFGFRSGVYRRCLTRALEKPNGKPLQRALEYHKGLARHYEARWQSGRRVPDLYRAAAQAVQAGEGFVQAISLSLHAAEEAARRGDWSEGLQSSAAVLSNAQATDEDRLRAHLARLRCEFGAHPRPRRPVESAREALDAAEKAPDLPAALRAELQVQAALRLQDRDELDESVQLAEEVIDEASASPLTRLHAAHVLGRGLWLSVRNAKETDSEDWARYERAIEVLEEACDRPAEDRSTRQELAKLMNTLGDVLADAPHGRERNPKALECFDRSIELKRELGDQYGEAITQGSIGRYYLNGPEEELAANAEAALAAFRRDLDLSRELGDLDGLVKIPNWIGEVLFKTGRAEEAILQAEQSLALARRLDREFDQAFALALLAKALGAAGEFDEARRRQADLAEIASRWPQLEHLVEASAAALG